MEHKEQASAQPAESKEQVLRRQIMAIQRDASLDAKQKAERIQVEFLQMLLRRPKCKSLEPHDLRLE